MEMFGKNELSEINYTSTSDLELLDDYNQTECDLKSSGREHQR